MPNFTAGTSFTDGVTNDVTAAKLNALIADAVPTSNLSLNSTTGTIANFTSSTANITLGTIPTLTSGTTTGTAATFTSGTITTGVIPTLTSTTLITSGTGTAASPAIQPTGDTNTGIFFPAADTIAFSEGGTESMRIDSNGRVGIGTSSPSYPMDIVADSNAFALNLRGRSVDNLGYIRFSTNNGATNHAAVGTPALNTLALDTNATERLRIDSSGNVGIGTTSPTSKLDIKSANAAGGIQLTATTGTNGSYANFVNSSGAFIIGKDSSTGGNLVGAPYSSCLYSQGAYPMIFCTDSVERLRITSGGDLLVGTTVSSGIVVNQEKLQVQALSNGIGVKTAAGNASDTPIALWNTATTGDNRFIIYYTDSGNLRGSIDYNRAAGLARYNTTSDSTLKNIIGDSSGAESIKILKNTRIRDYTWKNDSTNKVNVGVIAQELYEVFKGAVSVGGEEARKDADGNDVISYQPWGVDKTAFTFHLVAGWQAHEKLIQELKSENDNLKNRIAALEAA